MNLGLLILAGLIAIGVKAEDKLPSVPVPTVARRVLPRSCVDHCFNPLGKFHDCESNEIACICDQSSALIDEYIDTVAPCIKDRDPKKCTPGGLSFVCAQKGSPITKYPEDIKTWINTELWTKYKTSRISEAPTTTQGSDTLISSGSEPPPTTTLILTSTRSTIFKTEIATPTSSNAVQSATSSKPSASATPNAHTNGNDSGNKSAGSTQQEGKKSSTSHKVAIGVGTVAAILGASMAVALVMYLLRRRKAAKASAPATGDEPASTLGPTPPPKNGKDPKMLGKPPPYASDGAAPSELDWTSNAVALAPGDGQGGERISVISELPDTSSSKGQVPGPDANATPTVYPYSPVSSVEGNGFVFELDATDAAPSPPLPQA
ncbi:hypothetical protein CC80DRAFT_557819 [Byssothecium circinans]|uniref:Extracellular membrane protein CFEM domain-containing protein n=1 Tax=Byssothecium circinans TaxID=147558 RepID=A0A6A5UF46_9PLEO|nr:hypothetical protein CC80DRAFT_557819 [Byssothecium circinans]